DELVLKDGRRGANQVFEKRRIGSIRQRFTGLFWLASRSCGTTHAGDIIAMNPKTLDFSPLLEFLVGTALRDEPSWFGAVHSEPEQRGNSEASPREKTEKSSLH